MTPMEKLTSMKQADLVALCEKWGVKVKATKGKLKEKRLPVQERLIAAGWPDGKIEEEPVAEETVQSEFQEESQEEPQETFDETVDTESEDYQDDDIPDNPMSEEEQELIEALKDFTEIYPDVTVEEIGYRSYELRKDDAYIGIVTPCKDNVIIAFTSVEAFTYEDAVNKLTELVG